MNQEATNTSVESVESTLLDQTSAVVPPIPDTQDQLLEVTLALIGIIVLIYGLAWFLKRGKNLVPSAGIPMKTLGVLPMGVKEKIILVEVGSKQILLGMTPHNITSLATFDEPVMDSSQGKQSSFSTKLKEILSVHSTQSNHIETHSKPEQPSTQDRTG